MIALRVAREIMVTATIIINKTMTKKNCIHSAVEKVLCARSRKEKINNIFLPQFHPVVLCVLYVTPPFLRRVPNFYYSLGPTDKGGVKMNMKE